MLQGYIKDMRLGAMSFVNRYLARASVAVPFIVAFGFATAALDLDLAARFGASKAFWIMAAGFCALGLIAGLALSLWQRETAATEQQQAAQSDQSGLGEMAEAATQAAGRLPLALLAPLLASPSASALAATRLLRRNMPLVVLLALIVVLISSTDEAESASGEADENAGAPDQRREGAPEEDPYREAA